MKISLHAPRPDDAAERAAFGEALARAGHQVVDAGGDVRVCWSGARQDSVRSQPTVWIGRSTAPRWADVVVGGPEPSAPWQRVLPGGPESIVEAVALAPIHFAVLEAYAVPRSELFSEARLLWLRRQLALLAPVRILDVGFGIGYSSYAICDGRPFTAVDVSPDNLRFARQALGGVQPAPCLVRAAGEVLPFRSGTFDCVLLSEVLEHIGDERALLAELRRVVRPGGHLLVSVPGLRYGFDGFLRLMKVKTVHDVPGPEFHVRPGYRPEQLLHLMEGSGFSGVRADWLIGPIGRATQDLISAAHLLVERGHGRRSWVWADAAALGRTRAFRWYERLVPALRLGIEADRILGIAPGFQLVGCFRRT